MPFENLLRDFLEDPRTVNLYRCDPQRAYVHIAVLMRRGKVLAKATNKNGSRSSGSGYSDRSIHAEKNVVKELGDIRQLCGADLYVMRLKRNWKSSDEREFMSSKPCRDCQLFLEKCQREYGLKNVYYTD